MNKQRRKTIYGITRLLERLSDADTKENLLEKCELYKGMIEDVQSDEEDAFDNMPENLQGSMRGEESEEAIDSLQNAYDALDDLSDESSREEIMDAISNAIDGLGCI